jgi:hypothetical protein
LFPSQKAVKVYVDASVVSGAPDATTTTKGKIQLAGDLAGTAALPVVATGAIGTTKLADAAVTNTKLDKGNIPLSGFSAAAAAVDLGSNKLVNVTDPTAAQDAATKNYVDTATAATTTSLATKEDKANKSTTTTLGTSDLLYPTQNAVKTYADAKVQDVITDAVTTSAPTQNAVYDALLLKENTSNRSISVTTDATFDTKYPSVKAVKTYVDNAIAGGTIVDADATTKGKIQLAGDLTGTAALPVVAAGAIGTTKLADAAVTTVKLAANAVTIAKLPTGATATTYLRGDGTWVNPSADPPLATISASTSLDATYAVVRVNTTAGNVTITLPAASSALNRSYTIIKIDSSNNSLAFNLPIYYDVSSSFTQANVQGTYIIKSDGTKWYLVN